MAELLPVPSLRSLRIFELSYYALWLYCPWRNHAFWLQGSFQVGAIKKSIGALVHFLLMYDPCLSLGWAASLRWDASMHLMSEQLLYLTKIGGNVVFSSYHCLHWILQHSDEMGWMPKAWGQQWLSTHCQSLTSHQLQTPRQIKSHRQSPQMDHSGRHTVSANFFLQEAKRFHLVCTRDTLS